MNKSTELCLHICKKINLQYCNSESTIFNFYRLYLVIVTCYYFMLGYTSLTKKRKWMPNTTWRVCFQVLSQTVTDCFQVASPFSKMWCPVHTAWLTQTWIAANCPEFISEDEWTPNSPDLNPLDYHVWGAMLDLYQKYQSRPTNISELKVALQSIWNDLPQDLIDRSILSFTKLLTAFIKANGGHFQYWVWLTNCIPYLLLQYAAPVVKYQQTDKQWQHYEYCVVLCWKCTVSSC